MIDFGALLEALLLQTGLMSMSFGNIIMILVGGVMLYLGIIKNMNHFCS